VYKHILIATDGSELAQKAVAQGLALAKQVNAKATAVAVTEPWDALSMAALAESRIPNPVADYEERMKAYANRVLWSVSEAAKKVGHPCLTLYVKDQGCDLIVMASHGRRGLSKLLLGSQATKVVTLSPVPVLVCR
jgi:nucleotide-binding universal stress UspA family protein